MSSHSEPSLRSSPTITQRGAGVVGAPEMTACMVKSTPSMFNIEAGVVFSYLVLGQRALVVRTTADGDGGLITFLPLGPNRRRDAARPRHHPQQRLPLAAAPSRWFADISHSTTPADEHHRVRGGGAIYASDDSEVVVVGSTVSDNHADVYGAAIMMRNATGRWSLHDHPQFDRRRRKRMPSALHVHVC